MGRGRRPARHRDRSGGELAVRAGRDELEGRGRARQDGQGQGREGVSRDAHLRRRPAGHERRREARIRVGSLRARACGRQDWTFTADQDSDSQGTYVWTGTVHEDEMRGKLVWTKSVDNVL